MPTVKVVANPSKGDGMPESVQEAVRTHLGRGRACLNKGKYDDAIEDYDKAIALAPNDAIAYYNRGVAYYEKGDKEQAIADFRKALEINPSYENAKEGLKLAELMR